MFRELLSLVSIKKKEDRSILYENIFNFSKDQVVFSIVAQNNKFLSIVKSAIYSSPFNTEMNNNEYVIHLMVQKVTPGKGYSSLAQS